MDNTDDTDVWFVEDLDGEEDSDTPEESSDGGGGAPDVVGEEFSKENERNRACKDGQGDEVHEDGGHGDGGYGHGDGGDGDDHVYSGHADSFVGDDDDRCHGYDDDGSGNDGYGEGIVLLKRPWRWRWWW